MNNRLEHRLRSELPDLADALLANAATSRAANRDTAREVLTPVERRRPIRRRPKLRAVAAVAAGLVGLAAIGIAADRLDRRSDATQLQTASEPLAGFGHWEPIADAPIEPRPRAATAWTGSRVVFWAGSSLSRGLAYTDGAIYDPARDSWDTMVVPGWGHPGLTSTFFDGELYVLAKGGGARFSPTTGEWRDLPLVDGLFLAATVATDEAVWGLGPASINSQGQPDLAIARYQPASDTWVYGPCSREPTHKRRSSQGSTNSRPLRCGPAPRSSSGGASRVALPSTL